MITNEVDQITLECLINQELYSKILSKESKNIDEIYINNKKKYKKEISQIFKNLYKNTSSNSMPTNITDSHTEFIKSCISYLKLLDKNMSKNINNNDDNMQDHDINYIRTINLTNINTLDDFVKKPDT